MEQQKIAFVVGHSNWGKSSTLRALTGGSHRIRRTRIKDVEFFIRRMSNDDLPKSFIDRMKSLDPRAWPCVIAALCPDFENKAVPTEAILKSLQRKGYELFFWVIRHQYGTSETISQKELDLLKRLGTIEVFSDRSEAEVRAKKFESFVKKVVLA